MRKLGLVGLGLGAAIVGLVLVFFLSHPGSPPPKSPEQLEKPAAKPQIPPEPKEKPRPPMTAPAPAPVPLPAAAPPAPPQPLPGPPLVAPKKPVTKPEAAAPPPQVTELPALEPTKKYGFLAGSYRRYGSAAKRMENLKKKGLPAFIRGEKRRYRVWVGPFASRQEARAAAKSLRVKRKRTPKIRKLEIPVPK